ncbi:flagellin [Halorubellus sp. JP-L1]|uniref:archaellin/type IV pilin N-terminal domain-containing protein n=1 Tax=Halorubellus sp. JP-L1 TaxID=2715753 RepID=UPI00140DAA63|nr:archaellin/type IV pilin N-terminal domain-containing protein [Halorubellus sp. JP-L1]NHN41646.1 flagellin [Halorubellus sp. JP-L1]
MNVPEAHDSRGQVGIGTLIIFIAMVLVAAVAAGVLINTAGMLEAKASDTSQDSQAQVSNHIVVVSAVGEVDQANDSVGTLNLTLMKAAGAGDMDLEKASFEYISDDAAVSLKESHSAVDLTATDGSGSYVLNSRDDRIVLTIRVNDTALEGPGGLQSGQKAMITMVTASGAKSLYGVNVPQTISDEKYVKV